MRIIYYLGVFVGAFMIFRFDGTREFVGAAILSVSIIAATARAMKGNE